MPQATNVRSSLRVDTPLHVFTRRMSDTNAAAFARKRTFMKFVKSISRYSTQQLRLTLLTVTIQGAVP
jgi:hypothetical protein